MNKVNDNFVAVAHKWMGFWQGADLSAFNDIHHPEFIDHSPSGRASNRDGFRQGIEELYRAFPDLMSRVDDLIIDAESQKIAIRWSAVGTHRGEFLGVPATGRKIRLAGIEIIEIRNRQVIARWGEWDGLDIREQLTSPRPDN